LRQKQLHGHAIGTPTQNFCCHTKAQDPTAPTREKAKKQFETRRNFNEINKHLEKFQRNQQEFGNMLNGCEVLIVDTNRTCSITLVLMKNKSKWRKSFVG
jgi:hypothetical protein